MIAAVIVCASLAQLPPLTAKTADEYLVQLREEQPNYMERLETVAKAFVGVPYDNDALGDGPDSRYDPGPLIDLSKVDAFTYVDQCLALAAATSLEEATHYVTEIRYIEGDIDYTKRNHFFIAEWAVNNAFVTDITRDVGPQVRSLMRFVSRKSFFEETPAASLFAKTRDEGITISYIWRDDVAKAAPKIPNGSIIAFVGRTNQRFCDHVGLFFKGKKEDDSGAMYHASPKERRVMTSDFAEYVEKTPEYVGFMVYEVHPERMYFVEDLVDATTEPDAAPSKAP